MKKIDRYILSQFLNLLLVSIFGFIILFVLVDYVENIDKFIDSKIPINAIISYYFYSIPWFTSIGLPMAMLVSTIFTIGLLLKRNELTAMKAAGVSLYRIATPIIILSIIISIAGFYFDNSLVTFGNKKCKEIEKKFVMKSRNSTFSLKKKNIFLSKNNQSQIAIDKYFPRTNLASGVAIQYMKNGKLNKRIDAHKMEWNNEQKKWVLNTYAIRNFNDEGFEKLLDINHGEYLAKGGIQAGTVVLFINLMPFIYARFNKQISNDQLTVALKKFIPDLTAKTIHRVTLLSMIGPLYAFFLITKAIGKTFVNDIDFEEEENKPKKKGMSRREFMLLFTPKLV